MCILNINISSIFARLKSYMYISLFHSSEKKAKEVPSSTKLDSICKF
jgi:hypothetical protein